MFEPGGLWGLATILGPLLLFGALMFGVITYRRRSAASKQHTENATRRIYKAGSEQERQEEEGTRMSGPPIKPMRGR